MKPSKATIETNLTDWLRLRQKQMKIQSECAATVQPFKETFEKKSRPFLEKANAELAPINERLALLASDIEKEMRKGVDEEAGTIALAQVLVGRRDLTAIAEIVKEEGDRTIDAERLFNFVKAVERGPAFWGCFKVLIGKAEKFLGDKINEIAKKPTVFKFKVSIPELEKKKAA